MGIWTFETSDGTVIAAEGDEAPDRGDWVPYGTPDGRTVHLHVNAKWSSVDSVPEGAQLVTRWVRAPKTQQSDLDGMRVSIGGLERKLSDREEVCVDKIGGLPVEPPAPLVEVEDLGARIA